MDGPKKIEQPADTIPVFEEEVVVDKHSVVAGRVRVRTITESVNDVAHATLEKQNIEIRRVPIDQ
jgi:carbonic anhydrase/acetyltransferase-like protein (isoleucine patch superfamily)